ncbi:MAG: hypothetical protein JWO15_1807 [Sphingomonadales bacterium]|nr:hypothetical protein [Sphingomonadales bacterium]
MMAGTAKDQCQVYIAKTADAIQCLPENEQSSSPIPQIALAVS